MSLIDGIRIESAKKPSGLRFVIDKKPELDATLVSFKRNAFSSKISANKLNQYLREKSEVTSAKEAFEIVDAVVNDGRTTTPFFLGRQSLAMRYAYNRVNLDESTTRLETAEYWILNNDTYYVLMITAPTKSFPSFDSKIRSAIQALHLVY